jgi:hypothetical protein
VSWFHINAESLVRQWEQEKNWTQTYGWNKPYLFRDAFHDYVEPHIEPRKEGWDNLSGDAKIVAPEGRQQKLKDEAEAKKEHHDSDGDDSESEDPTTKHTETEKKKDKKEHKREDKREDEKEGKKENTKEDKKEDKKEEDTKEDTKESPDWEKLPEKFADAADSADNCSKTCEQVEDCLQWRYIARGDGECHLSKVLRLGSTDQDGKWTSGWLVERVKEVQKEWECKKADWRFYQ